MSDPFLGEIRMVGFNYAPEGWALCNGQTMQVGQNQALFSVLGTAFGGDGRVTFGLPDLQGRSPVGSGTGAGLAPVPMGAKAGVENITLTQGQLPVHTHAAQFNGQAAPVNGSAATTVTVPVGTSAADVIVQPTSGGTSYLTAVTAKAGTAPVMISGLYTGTAPSGTPAKLGGVQASTSLSGLTSTSAGAVAVGQTGGSQPVPTRNPYLGVCFIIATQGLYPVRP
ncbi:MAG TPA: tail fiber protein [Burkholderiaceae bacterium]|nr:tail fiber protein [Burkholderiaceae bacterium]